MYVDHSKAKVVLVGVCLWFVRQTFGNTPPTLSAYCKSAGVSDDTIRRTARALLPSALCWLRSRRPGRKKRVAPEPSMTHQALKAMNDLLRSLLPRSIPKLLKSPSTRGVVVQQVRFWREKGVELSRLAEFLHMSPRQLSRWIDRLQKEGDGREVPANSRRPHNSPNQLPDEIQHAVRSLAAVCPGFSIAELTRMFNQRFGELLRLYELQSVSAKTIGKYASGRQSKTKGPGSGSRRGAYQYPPPMTMAWIDTTQFSIAGMRIHIVVAMEAFSRMTLAGDAVAQDNSEAVATVLSEALTRAPDLRALVRDRGTPYLNQRIDALLANRGCQPIDAHAYFPIDKAALERFFGTAKPWLRAALAQLEREWSQRPPSQDEILSAVRSALQMFLRAYNLIPQPYLEAKCPFERLEKALRASGAGQPELDRFQQLAREREDKTTVLERVRDGLQIKLSPDQMLRDFAGIDKRAIQSAFDVCFEKIVIQRDQSIRWPYRYILVVARRKSRDLLVAQAQARRSAEDDTRRRVRQQKREDELRHEHEDRTQNPERHVQSHLEAWLRCQVHPAFRGGTGESRLRETLQALADNLGAAFGPYIRQIKAGIPKIVQRMSAAHSRHADRCAEAFMKLAIQPPSDVGPVPGLASARPSCNNIRDTVRQALAAISTPQNGVTNVPP